MKPYTIVLTSCGRFDLLRRTLESLFAHLDAAPARTLVIEDSGDEAVRAAVDGLAYPVDVIVNAPQLGQIRAIDKAYATVDTPHVFHCEDDWEFFRSGFIAESQKILERRADISMVGLRPREELNPLVKETPTEVMDGLSWFPLDPSLHPEYFSYSFNPGLRRLADYKRLGPFAALPTGTNAMPGEPDVSYAFKQAGFRMAYLEAPAVRHIGDGRHVADPHGAKRPTNMFERLQRSIEKRLKRRARKKAARTAS